MILPLWLLAFAEGHAARRSLGVRGGGFDFDARETAELCGIEEPAKEVTQAIKDSARFTMSALRLRGGSFDFDARETAEICGIEDPAKEVVAAIRSAPGALASAPGKLKAALGVRGGSFTIEARNTADICGIVEPEKEVVKVILSVLRQPTKLLRRRHRQPSSV